MPVPKVIKVKPLAGKRLLILFQNGETKLYDCNPLLEDDRFFLLKQESMFKNVHVDKHGFGVVWNDELDLAESELWINGHITEPAADIAG